MYHEIAAAAVDGHGAQHNRTELAMLLAVVHQVIKPRLMVEIGSWRGGSLYAWSRLAIPVVAVTLPEKAAEPFRSHGARMVWGNSHDPGVQAQLLAQLGGKYVDLVFIDGDHTETGARQDLDLAARLAPGGVIVMHDINLHRRHPDVGVRRVWDKVAAWQPTMVLEANPDTAPGVGVLFPGPVELPA